VKEDANTEHVFDVVVQYAVVDTELQSVSLQNKMFKRMSLN
jgi:hypothetical protein